MKAFFRTLWDLFGRQPSLHVIRVGDYTYSYRTQPFGPPQYFSVDAVTQAEADMLAWKKMKKLVAEHGALKYSIHRE